MNIIYEVVYRIWQETACSLSSILFSLTCASSKYYSSSMTSLSFLPYTMHVLINGKPSHDPMI
jgi:hypothetical protein